MAAAAPHPAWVNLEYLSAERWVERTTACPHHIRGLPLVKHFSFPALRQPTGGADGARLPRCAKRFRQSAALAAFWRSLGVVFADAGAAHFAFLLRKRRACSVG
jgi:hypothetical protein